MSDRYDREIIVTRDWFKARLSILGKLTVSRADYTAGIDALPEAYRALSKEACRVAMDERQYELSYQQSCRAMFGAAYDLGLLEIVEPVPVTKGRSWTPEF